MNFINGYTIRPAATPFAMLYVKGINTMTKYAGKPSVQSEKSISRMASIIKAPTRISTGAVAAFGTKAMRGAKNKQRINMIPQVTAVKPVRPPAPTPAALSTKAVMVLEPNIAPKLTPRESTIIALPRPGNSPFLGSAIPALEAVAIKVPMESNNSTKVKEKMMVIKPTWKAEAMSNSIKATLLKSGIAMMLKELGSVATPVA